MPIHHQWQQTTKLTWPNNFSRQFKKKGAQTSSELQSTPARKGSTSDNSNANTGLK